MRNDFFVVYRGDMTTTTALRSTGPASSSTRTAWESAQHGAAMRVQPTSLFIRWFALPPESEEDARRQVTNALGREPDAVRVHRGQ